MNLVTLFIITGIALASMLLVSPYIFNSTNSQIQEDNQKSVVEYIIEPGDTFASIMEKLGIVYEDTNSILDASKGVYDFSEIRAGQLLKLVFVKNAFTWIEYDINDEEMVIAQKQNNNFRVDKKEILYDIQQAVAGATITTSLFIDAQEAEIEDKIILELAEIFGWDIDFATDIQENDSFKIIYEKRLRDGKTAGSGRILAARFQNQGIEHWAFFYKGPGEEGQYYNLEGQSLARQFLRSPLNYLYISSGFSYNRLHPVLKKATSHRAIDYAAPPGTPIISTADGQIVYAGWNGGNGIYIEIKHNGIYSTQYAHLSGLAKDIKKGMRVKQGRIIGYVGSTGFSTGYHLQYSMTKNGALINPLTVDLPLGEFIKDEWGKSFDTIKKQFQELLK